MTTDLSKPIGWVYYNAGSREKPYWIPGHTDGRNFWTISSVETAIINGGLYLFYPTKTKQLHYPYKLNAFPNCKEEV